RHLGVSATFVGADSSEGLDDGFRTMARDRFDALFVLLDPLTFIHRARIVAFAARNRLPDLYMIRDVVLAGGLVSYRPGPGAMICRNATYVDKILKGAQPRDLPVEQPTRFELVINLKTAKALGLTIPPSLLLRADQVIE